MQVEPAGSSRRGQPRTEGEQQGVAQLLNAGQRGTGLLLPAADGRPVLNQLNESPQAHEPVAFGLSIVKPCFSMVSTKSMTAPST